MSRVRCFVFTVNVYTCAKFLRQGVIFLMDLTIYHYVKMPLEHENIFWGWVEPVCINIKLINSSRFSALQLLFLIVS